MTTDTALVWFRSDLRVHDNAALVRALEAADSVVPVYCFDPGLFGPTPYGPDKTGPHRARFLRESVRDLRETLHDRGGDLVVRHESPATAVPEIAELYGVEEAYFQTLPATEEHELEQAVVDELGGRGVDCTTVWTHTLYHREDLPTPPSDIDDTFTPWRKEVESEASVRDPLPTPETVPVPASLRERDNSSIPTLSTLGIADDSGHDDRAVLDFEGGETAGRGRLEQYVWERDRLREYKETRNGLLGADYSSKLSPWLAAGCLSPRYVHEEVRAYESERVENESTYWLRFELCWRDFFQFQFEKHGSQFFQPGGIRERSTEWDADDTAFERWASGETGIPFVDANMRELNATGYMSNRGRQNVASFLANDLGIDWRRGAAYFEAQLVDYDVCSNWGNWAYVAGVGNDSRDRAFDVVGQAQYYDDEAEYVTHWLPELAVLPPGYAHEPWQLDDDQQAEYGVELGVDYPRPMIAPEKMHQH